MVVPLKKKTFGKHFGFTRFWDVGDERVFSMKVDDVVIDGRKTHANYPRF